MLQNAGLSVEADPESNLGGSSETMYYIGLDVHKKTISFCVKDAAGRVQQEGKIGSTRRAMDAWVETLPQPRMIAMEATIASGCILFRLSSVKDAALVKEWLFARHSATAGQALAPRTKQATSALPRRALCHFGAILAPKRD